jgi:hypothetical protein
MANEEQERGIRPSINPEGWATVRLLDAQNLTTSVTGGMDQLVDLSIEAQVPDMTQDTSVPLSQVEVAEDGSHSRRDSEAPLLRPRLMRSS